MSLVKMLILFNCSQPVKKRFIGYLYASINQLLLECGLSWFFIFYSVTSIFFHIIETLLHGNYILNLNIDIYTFIIYFKLYFST